MPYDDSNVTKMVRAQQEKKVSFNQKISLTLEAKSLCHRMLEVDIKKRITVPGIYQHPWMKEHLPKLNAALTALWNERDQMMAPQTSGQSSQATETPTITPPSKDRPPEEKIKLPKQMQSQSTQTDGCLCNFCPEHS